MKKGQWRTLLQHDWDRIQVVERSQPFYHDLIRLMLDIDAPRSALLASELARARAFADLLAEDADNSTEPLKEASPGEGLSVEGLIKACTGLGLTVIEYFVLNEMLVSWVISPSGEVSVQRVDVSWDQLADAVTRLHTAAMVGPSTPSCREEMRQILRWVSEHLWHPLRADALPQDPDEPVVVVPHGPLFRIPFAALPDVNGFPLVHSHTLLLSPAIALLPDLVRRRGARGRRPADRCLSMVNPSPMPVAGQRGLEWTEQNFAAITTFYDPARTIVRSGAEASLAALRADAPHCDVLIFATHAKVVDAPGTDPLDSFIALAPSPGHNGMLRAREILDLDISADLVILNACETGAGLVTGDGVIGLSRSFLARGPTTMLMTLYEVWEQISLDLVYRFHIGWRREGMSAAVALRRAQIELCETFPDQPHLWASFVLFGLDWVAEDTS